MTFRVPSWETFAAGVEAADDIAKRFGVPVEKAITKILTPSGFDLAVRALLRSLKGQAASAEQKAFAAAAAEMDRDWANMTEAARNAVIAGAAKKLLQIPKVIVPKIVPIIAAHGREVVEIAKRDTARAHALKVDVQWNATDERVINFAAKSQGNYITDRFGNRAEAFEKKARTVVSEGLKNGLGRKQLGEVLERELVGPGLRAGSAYWETIASIHTARARSWAQLSSFQEAQITSYTWESVLDEVTSEQCRFLHGRSFNVGKSVQQFLDVEDSKDPYAVEEIQPWMRTGKTKDGGQALFVDNGKGRKLLAVVDSPGFGTSDKIGTYSNAVGDAVLQKLGVCVPPIHGRCRSTIIPS